jgi:hypothetical protein
MVPLVRALWSRGLTTAASCQDFGEGVVGQRARSSNAARYGGDAFIAFYAGYAWLEMPLPDLRRLAGMLRETEFHGRMTRRWTPGSWRMHVPVIPGPDGVIGLAPAVQVHFPREQAGRLAVTLEDLAG